MSDLGNKEIFSKNLQYYMSLYNKDRNDVCKDLDFKYPTFSDWYNGKKYPRIDKIELLAMYFGIEKSDLIENHETYKPKIKTVKIPVLGYVRAGIPIEAVEEIIGEEEIPEEWLKGGNEYFGLTIKGDSMFPFFIEGDTIIVKKQNTCENGEIAVVLVNGNDATVKEVKKNEDGISLIPYNRMYPPMNYTNEDITNMPITIVGIFQRLIRDKK